MSKKLFEGNFDRHPLNEIEAGLDRLESSWADFLYGLRGHGRIIRSERRPGMRARSLLTLHRILDGYRQQFEDGKRIAIWTALTCCIEENIPLPYWLRDAILDINEKVNREPSNLHDLFGLESLLPPKGQKASTTRRDLQLRQELWSLTKELMAGSKISKDAAVKQAREQLAFPYSQRKSLNMFDAQERIQSEYYDAWEGRKTHRIK